MTLQHFEEHGRMEAAAPPKTDREEEMDDIRRKEVCKSLPNDARFHIPLFR